MFSRASAGLTTEYLIVSNLECKGESELLRSDCLPPPHLGDRFGHPRAQTIPHHSIIHTPKMIVYLAPNKFQISKGSPPPTQSLPQIRSSTRTNDPTSFDHPPTEYLIVSSKPPTGYYVDGVTACPVSRASAGFTEYLIVSNLEPLPLEIVCHHHPILETHLVIHAHQTTIPRSYT